MLIFWPLLYTLKIPISRFRNCVSASRISRVWFSSSRPNRLRTDHPNINQPCSMLLNL